MNVRYTDGDVITIVELIGHAKRIHSYLGYTSANKNLVLVLNRHGSTFGCCEIPSSGLGRAAKYLATFFCRWMQREVAKTKKCTAEYAPVLVFELCNAVL